MARSFSTASDVWLSNTSFTVWNGASTCTIAGWIRRNTTKAAIGWRVNATSGGFLINAYSDNNIYYFAQNTSQTYGRVANSSTSWMHVAQAFDGGQTGNSDRLRCYLNGTLAGVTYTGTIPSTLGTIGSIGAGIDNALTGTDKRTNGYCAEVAVWTAALSADEIAALGAGYSPLSVRQSALAFYAPLFGRNGASGGEEDWVGGYTLSATGSPGVLDHPRIIYPRRRVIVPVAAGGGSSYNVSIDESITLSDVASTALLAVGSVAESISLTDAVTATGSFAHEVVESSTLSDSVAAAANWVVAVEESAAFSDETDGSIGAATYNVSLDESLSFSDAQSALMDLVATIAESLPLNDAVVVNVDYVVSVSEALALSEQVFGSIPGTGTARIRWRKIGITITRHGI